MEQRTGYRYEKLGLMYLGKELDHVSGQRLPQPLLYKNKHLTTHSVIIGMTGSGKTGLGIGLIEEAAMDNIPSIIIDPKGDMSNLALAFPECSPEDFLPWVDPGEAAKKELSPREYAAAIATQWREGLAEWGQQLDRVRAFSQKQDLVIYTPGSTAGVPVSVLGSFDAPAPDVVRDNDTFTSLINATTTSLLGLVGITGDSLQSREHILVSSLLQHHWRQQQDMSLELLIGAIVHPPFEKVGVFSLDTFYPQTERMSLAMKVNNIIASPSFSSWATGDPLSIQRILYSPEGKPRTAIFSIAHLSENERMFFVTMLLNQFIGWMRNQQGSSSLKALLYMDEIFGYFPPTSNPPSKKPMLLLLKQARAYGVGVVLATQNPVDLDYKGLSNIGTWFVGRLQAKQDQEKVVEGIAGASDGKLKRKSLREMLSNLKGRHFFLNSAHLEEPLLFETRWVMSYLKGPLSKVDIKHLMENRKNDQRAKYSSESPYLDVSVSQTQHASKENETDIAPTISSNVEQFYLLDPMVHDKLILYPCLIASASVRFYNAKRNIELVTKELLKFDLDHTFPKIKWQNGAAFQYGFDEYTYTPPVDATYKVLPEKMMDVKDLKFLVKEFNEYLYQNRRLELYRLKGSGFESKPNEKMVDFKIRVSDYLRDKREHELAKLKKKYQKKQHQLEARLNKAFARLDKEQQDVQQRKADSILSIGVAVLGAFLGRKKLSATTISRTASGMRKAGKVAKEKRDVERVENDIFELENQIEQLALEIEEQAAEITASNDPETSEIETFTIRPRRADVFDAQLVLLWQNIPWQFQV